MKAGTALAAWLADRAAQRASLDSVEASARKWGHHPMMTGLERELTLMDPKTPQAILDAARRYVDRIEDVDALMADMIASCRADPFFRPPMHPVSSDIHTGLLMFHNQDLSIALGVTSVDQLAAKKSGPRGATSIGFTGLLTSFRYLRAGNATLSFWEAPPIADNFVIGEAGHARLVERRRIRDGEEVVIDGRYQSFIIEHAESDMLYFQALVRSGGAPLATEYDSRTLSCISASSTDEAASRVQMMISLLRTMERDDAIPLVIEALNSPHFYTRWHIMRELLAMDAEAAHPHLVRMAADDPHPEVRATAARTLELFFADEEPTQDEGAVACRA